MTTALRSDRSFDSINTRRLAKQLVIVGRALADIADGDARIVAASADLKFSTLLSEFEDRHPERFFQFGISERNMLSAAAGMATCGLVPYVGTFASFAGLLCYEVIRTDLAYPAVPVRVLATHAGISMGYFGTSHHATEDLSALRSIAGLMVLSPADGASAASLLRATVDHPGPIYVRLSRGRDESLPDSVPALAGPGRPRVLRTGSELAIVATGLMVKQALDAAELLAAQGIEVSVLDVHTIKPFDAGAVAELVAGHPGALVVEEHNTEGGLGSLVLEALAARDVRVPLSKHGLHDEYCIIGPPHHCYQYYGLDASGIATVAVRLLELVNGGRFREHDPDTPLWRADDRAAVLERIRAAESGSR